MEQLWSNEVIKVNRRQNYKIAEGVNLPSLTTNKLSAWVLSVARITKSLKAAPIRVSMMIQIHSDREKILQKFQSTSKIKVLISTAQLKKVRVIPLSDNAKFWKLLKDFLGYFIAFFLGYFVIFVKDRWPRTKEEFSNRKGWWILFF